MSVAYFAVASDAREGLGYSSPPEVTPFRTEKYDSGVPSSSLHK